MIFICFLLSLTFATNHLKLKHKLLRDSFKLLQNQVKLQTLENSIQKGRSCFPCLTRSSDGDMKIHEVIEERDELRTKIQRTFDMLKSRNKMVDIKLQLEDDNVKLKSEKENFHVA